MYVCVCVCVCACVRACVRALCVCKYIYINRRVIVQNVILMLEQLNK